LLLATNALAQQSAPADLFVITPYSLTVSYSKTTNLVFPFAIKSVDRGSLDILVQKAKGLDNILQVKAGKECFTETNLTVVTSDGKLYSFILNYELNPSILNFTVADGLLGQKLTTDKKTALNDAELNNYCALAEVDKGILRGVKDNRYGIRFTLTGMFIKDNVMYFRIVLQNTSNINYDIDQLRFFIRDLKKAKRTASQEIEIKPFYIKNEKAIVTANSESTIVYALPKFTLPEKKFLAIQLVEKNGGRNLDLKIKDRKMLKLAILPSL